MEGPGAHRLPVSKKKKGFSGLVKEGRLLRHQTALTQPLGDFSVMNQKHMD